MASCWGFYFQDSCLPLSFCIAWSDSISNVHVDLWELQAFVLMLCTVAFHITGKAVGLLLDNSSAKAYSYHQGGTVSLFHSRLACCILNLVNKNGITLMPAYIPIDLNVKADYL